MTCWSVCGTDWAPANAQACPLLAPLGSPGAAQAQTLSRSFLSEVAVWCELCNSLSAARQKGYGAPFSVDEKVILKLIVVMAANCTLEMNELNACENLIHYDRKTPGRTATSGRQRPGRAAASGRQFLRDPASCFPSAIPAGGVRGGVLTHGAQPRGFVCSQSSHHSRSQF